MTEYELYLDRKWEVTARRYEREQMALWRGLGYGSLFSGLIWGVLYLIASCVWSWS